MKIDQRNLIAWPCAVMPAIFLQMGTFTNPNPDPHILAGKSLPEPAFIAYPLTIIQNQVYFPGPFGHREPSIPWQVE